MKRNITIAITMTVAIMIFASQAVAQSNFKDLSLPEVWQGKKRDGVWHAAIRSRHAVQ
jgi:hypothetical protein